jgi:hypothetical protein
MSFRQTRMTDGETALPHLRNPQCLFLDFEGVRVRGLQGRRSHGELTARQLNTSCWGSKTCACVVGRKSESETDWCRNLKHRMVFQ